MKKTLLVISISIFCFSKTNAQTLKDIFDQANTILNGGGNQGGSNQGLGSGLSKADIANGLKEALKIGTQNASGKLNKTNGFFGNQLIKIMLPQEVRKVEATLRQFGFGKQCDNLILSLNRAAEDAAGQAVPIFVKSITSMNLNDALGILRGGNTAATDFLKLNTTSALTAAFRPVIDRSLAKVNANKLWRDAFTLYNKLPITKQKINTDLTGYVTERALNGLFVTVAQEEANIRQNPAARVNDLLKNVFGR